MPALVAFGRRWQLGSDDFVFGGFLDLLIRVTCLISACIIYWQHDSKLTCPGGHNMRVYLIGNMAVLLAIIFSNLALIQNSMAGYIMDTEARKYVAPSLYLRLLLEVPEIGWNTLGTVWAFTGTAINCPEAPLATIYMKAVIIVNWSLVLTLVFFSAIFFDPLGAPRTSYEDLDYERFEKGMFHHKHTRVWERRCKLLCCSCVGSDELSRNAFKEVGKIMSFLFDDMDLVPTDIAAGLVVMHLKNQLELENSLLRVSARISAIEDELTEVSTSPNQNIANGISISDQPRLNNIQSSELSITVPNDPWNTPQIICHFMKYALGCYGWPWFLVAHPKTGLCQLWENILCCGCCISHPCDVVDDNCCFCNTSALKQTIDIDDKDLIYASFQNNIFCTPFYIAIDHSTKSIIIAIRGTLSLRDTLTDLSAEAKPLDVPNLPPNCKAHNGMMLSAKHVLQKLRDLKLLEKARGSNPDYNLVLAGHSLGAGTAAILAVMLRNEYPNIRCYAYSPPGGLMTEEAASFCEDFITSVVVGDDIISRLSVPAFEKFKKRLQVTIRECRTPKYRLLVGGCFYLLVGGVPKNLIYKEEGAATESDVDQRSDTQLLQNSNEPTYYTYVSLAEESHRLHRESITKCEMFPPGKIMHVTERAIFRSRPDLVDSARYEYRFADRNEFNEINVTPNMMTDHLPDNVYRALRDISTYSGYSL